MKKSAFIGLLVFFYLSGCNQEKEGSLTFSNPLEIPRENEVVHILYEEMENLIGNFETGKLPLFIYGEDTLTSQFINYQGDELPEEMLVQITLGPSEKKKVRVVRVDRSDYPVFSAKTSIHFARHENPGKDLETETRIQTVKTEVSSNIFQMEGPAWENDKVGFRNYFDHRNGMDIFGKRTEDLVLMYVGLNERTHQTGGYNFEKSYHELSDWGMDILKVGNSLGAGAVALEINDSLYRLGDNGNGTYEKLYEGPLKSEFLFGFPDWTANGKIRNITQYISISAGTFCYETSLFQNDTETEITFITGIVNKHSDQLFRFDAGENHFVFMTYDKQAEDSSMLAMAIAVDKETFRSFGETKDTGDGITETYIVKLETNPGKASSYSFYALWERSDPAFGQMESAQNFIIQDILRKENPVILNRK